jgi:hypothetical protein
MIHIQAGRTWYAILQAIFEVAANPGSTAAQRYPATICGGDECSSQCGHLHRTAGCFDISQVATRVFYQRDPNKCSNTVSIGAKAALCGSYDDQKVEGLLLGACNLGHV